VCPCTVYPERRHTGGGLRLEDDRAKCSPPGLKILIFPCRLKIPTVSYSTFLSPTPGASQAATLTYEQGRVRPRVLRSNATCCKKESGADDVLSPVTSRVFYWLRHASGR